jgi:hydroxyacylglutathione hydrolase
LECPNHIQLVTKDATNVYVFKDEGEAAVIDPYWDTNPILGLATVKKAVKGEHLTSILITHGHSDHYGGCNGFENTGAETIAHIGDAWSIEDPMYFFMQYFAYAAPTKTRFETRLKEIGGKGSRVHRVVRDGDDIRIGSRKLEVIHVPGHSYGSICLYEKREGALFIGDTPYPSAWLPVWLGLVVDAEDYSRSLARLSKLSPTIVLPGHAEPFEGGDWSRELGLHIEHWRKCESSVLDVLDENRYMSLRVVVDKVVKNIVPAASANDVTFRLTEWVTVHSLLRKLCFDGKVEQGRGFVWRLA